MGVMAMRPRDNQRSRVYEAERNTFQWGQTVPDELLQATVDDVLDRHSVRARFGPRRINVERGKGGGRAWGMSRISLGVEARNEWVICHEIAHCLTPGAYASHGPEYVGVYLFLVKTIIGADAAARLKAALRDTGAKWNSKAVPKPTTGTRVPPRQYESLAVAKARWAARQPKPEVVAARRLAAAKASATKQAKKDEPVSFPLRFRMGKRMAGEMYYQHDVDVENAEHEGEAVPTWRVDGLVLIADDMYGLDRAMYRASCAGDWEEMNRAATSLRDRMKDAVRRVEGEGR